MARHVTPQIFTAQQIAESGHYSCPLCHVQTTSDKIDIGWVLCPMLAQRAICYGCCIDFQGVARSDDFEKHPFSDLFDDVVALTGKSMDELRQICLQHQDEILRGNIEYNG